MRVGATLRLHNAALKSARVEMGMTVKQAAEHCGICVPVFYQLQAMKYSMIGEGAARKVAEGMCLSLEEVWPASLRGRDVPTTYEKEAEIPAQKLLSCAARDYRERFMLPSPADVMARADQNAALRAQVKRLRPRQAQVLELRYGFGSTQPLSLEETGQILGLSRERVRQLQIEAEGELYKKLTAAADLRPPPSPEPPG